ncbi:MAG TPA: hypothetical protein VEY91_00470 [Candidatus Limnocylindria bacterium]|nr:hypothetical protein [Candidatus Limnocylindria bacterium]
MIERSGEAALVARIARSRNLARIRDLAGEKALVAWLDGNGLTLAEAARIQPAYEGERPSDNFVQGLTIASATLGAGLGTAGVALNASTATSPNRRNVRGLLGVACGLIGAGLGAPALADDDGALRTFGALDICVGLVSVGLGIRQLNATSDRHGPAASPAVWRDDNGTRRVALVVRF